MRYRAAGLKANPKKSELGMKEVVFLGHVIDARGIRPNPQKISAVQSFEPPTDVTEVRSFLGLVNYYRRFIPDMARIALPIQALTRKGAAFIWDDACDLAFQRLKELLTSAPLLRRPDFNQPFILQTDWQPTGMGAILSQNIENVEHVIAYASKSLKIQEQHYAPTEGELLACLWAIRHFHCYLHGHRFVLETDHKALTYLLTSKNLSTKLTRYAMELQEYDFEMRHRPGHLHTNVDALSRLLPVQPAEDPCMYTILHCTDNEPRLPEPTAKHKRGRACDSPAIKKARSTEAPPPQASNVSPFQMAQMHKRGTDVPMPNFHPVVYGTGQGIDETATDPPGTSESDKACQQFLTPSIFTALFPSSEAPVDLTGGESDNDSQRVIYVSTPPKDTATYNQQPLAANFCTPIKEDDGPPISPDMACRNCQSQESPETMLICDRCQEGYHIDCLDPPLESIPDDKWFCLACDALGMENNLPKENILDITLDKNVLRYMETGKFDVEWTRQEKQRVYRRARNYSLQDGHIYFRPNARYHWPRKVPNIEDRDGLIKACHDDLGHFGIVRTCYILQERFYWSNMTHDVRGFVNTCATCATKKASFLLPDKLQSFPVSARFDRVHIDLMGPFPATPRGNKYIVCCIEAFTKWPEAAAIPNKEAITVADFFLTNIVSRHGVPQTVVSDNGAEFDGEFSRLLEDCNIEHRHSSPNHPQTNGLVERFNQTLRKALQKSIKQDKDWDLHLNKILFGYRIGMQASTQHSPFELLYGRPAVIPIQNACRPTEHIPTEPSNYSTDEGARQLIQKVAPFNDMYDNASMHLQRAQQRQQKEFQKRHIARTRKSPENDQEYDALHQESKHKSEVNLRKYLPAPLHCQQPNCQHPQQPRSHYHRPQQSKKKTTAAPPWAHLPQQDTLVMKSSQALHMA